MKDLRPSHLEAYSLQAFPLEPLPTVSNISGCGRSYEMLPRLEYVDQLQDRSLLQPTQLTFRDGCPHPLLGSVVKENTALRQLGQAQEMN